MAPLSSKAACIQSPRRERPNSVSDGHLAQETFYRIRRGMGKGERSPFPLIATNANGFVCLTNRIKSVISGDEAEESLSFFDARMWGMHHVIKCQLGIAS